MSLIVEDGTGMPTAQSYVSVADASTYHANHGNSAWGASTDPLREAALIRGTQAMDAMYSGRWPGYRCNSLQALEWPRFEAWDRDGYAVVDVAQAIKNACSEAALIELVSPGALSLSLERGGMLIRKKTGPLEKEWAPGAPTHTIYPTIRQPLSRILRGGVSIGRASG